MSHSLHNEYPLVRAYSRYAPLYDRLGQSEFGLGMLPLVQQAAHRHGVAAGRLLDLACGTGSVAIALALRGYDVTGVDRSAQMLRIAREKSRAQGTSCRFLRQDIANLSLPRDPDIAVCLYDSLNYLLRPQQLRAAFDAVARVLRPGGIFLFDMNTLHCIARDWGNRVAEERCDSALLIHNYRYDPRTHIGRLELSCIVNSGGRIEKFREIHRERGYAREEIRATIDAAGLELLEEMSFPDLAPPTDRTSKAIYVARKPQT